MHAFFLNPEPEVGGPTNHGNDDVVQVSGPGFHDVQVPNLGVQVY